MFKSIAIILLAIGLAQASSVVKAKPHSVQSIANPLATVRADDTAWVDEILANVRTQLLAAGLDTILLPDFILGFSQTILGITWHGEAGLSNGLLKGIETLHRTGTADVTIEPNGDLLVTLEAGVNDGTLAYALLVKFMDLGPKATATGTIKNIRVLITLRVDTQLRPKLEKFDIKNLGTLSIDIKGLGIILNFLVEIVVNAIGNVVKGVVGELLQGVIKGIVNSVIEGILFPETSRTLLQLAAIQQQAQHLAAPVPYIR